MANYISSPIGIKFLDSAPVDQKQLFSTATLRDAYEPTFLYEGLFTYVNKANDSDTNTDYYHTLNGTWSDHTKGFYYISGISGNTVTWSGLMSDTVDGKHAYGTINSGSNSSTNPGTNNNITDHVNYIYTILSGLSSGRTWKEAVATYADLAINYPDAIAGWAATVQADNKIYIYNGTTWVATSTNTPSLSASVDGIVSHTWYNTLYDLITNTSTYLNQNAYSSVIFIDSSSVQKAGSPVTANTTSDSITFKEGTGISFSVTDDVITINSTSIGNISGNDYEVFFRYDDQLSTISSFYVDTNYSLHVNNGIYTKAYYLEYNGVLQSVMPIGIQSLPILDGTNDRSIGIGYNTFDELSYGVDRIALGNNAGYHQTGNTNIFIGTQAFYDNSTTGTITNNNNIGIGHYVGKTNRGANNVFIGNNVDYAGNYSNLLIIGNNLGTQVSPNVKTLLIGDFSTLELNLKGTLKLESDKLLTFGSSNYYIGRSNGRLGFFDSSTTVFTPFGTGSSITTKNITTDSIINVTNGTNAVLNDVYISIYQANATTSGYLSSTDWIKFNNKIDQVSSAVNNHIAIFNNGSIIDSGVSIIDMSAAVFTEDVTATVNLNGVEIGDLYAKDTLLEIAIKDIIAPYVKPILNTLSISATPSGTIEVGTTITINSATWSYTVDSDSNPPKNMYLTGTGFNKNVTGTTTTATGSTTVVKTTDTTETWSISGYDKNDIAIAAKSYSIQWLFKWFFGASSTIPTNNATATTLILSLQQQTLKSGKSNTVTCGSYNDNYSNYTFIAYAAKYGTITSIIQNGALPVIGAFTLIGTFLFTNSNGVSENYYIYKSNATKAFASGVSLAIS